MKKTAAVPAIRLRGVRHNNLKNFDLDLPLNRLVVITGLSGSGKSSLAFDTLFAEGQRRYIETFSPYARQFFDRMDKPQVDSIEGIPPAIAIEQRNSVRTTRSTVGTITEVCDYMKMLWPHISQLYCRQCGEPVVKDTPERIWKGLIEPENGEGRAPASVGTREVLVTFHVPLTEKLSLEESLALISRQGYQKIIFDGEVVRLEEFAEAAKMSRPAGITVVQDRVKVSRENRARFVEACEQAFHFGKGKLRVAPLSRNIEMPSRQGPGEKEPGRKATESSAQLNEAQAEYKVHSIAPARSGRESGQLPEGIPFSNMLHCAKCDLEYKEPSQALFSFNHPAGACPACRGFGRIITIDYNLALPDKSRTLAGGVVKPWQSGQSAECQSDLAKFCRIRKVPMDVPFRELSQKWQDWVINGDPDYGKDSRHEWPRAWYGVKGYFRWLESKSYKMHVRVLLSRYRAYKTCPSCEGKRFQPETLLYRAGLPKGAGNGTGGTNGDTITLSDFYRLPIRDAQAFVEGVAETRKAKSTDPVGIVMNQVRARLGFLNEVGLGYLTLERPTRSLSGGETERVNLTTCLGTQLVNTLFVLDEPSVGLHPRDTGRLIRILERLRNAGNTVVVVEHEASVMRAADEIIDIGPGHGAAGGHVVFHGKGSEIGHSKESLTGKYLSGEKEIEIPTRRVVDFGARGAEFLTLKHATLHNLNDVEARIPLARLVCLTGVSGSGKTTLAREILLPALAAKFQGDAPNVTKSSEEEAPESEDGEGGGGGASGAVVEGWEPLGRVVLVDQSILAKTPRSNPAVYIGAFEDLRQLFADSEVARQRGLNASAFSFNSGQGQCERCRGAGFEKIEMQFLSDVFIRCPECNGRRYRPHILAVTIEPEGEPKGHAMSIADLLDATVDEVIELLARFPDSRPAQRAAVKLELLREAGLGYLKLGQPINTMSGGESQRLKLVRHLADFSESSDGDTKPTLFLFDEPTTGLHFDDVRVLLGVFQRLVNAGHSVIIIEHNLDVIKSSDWVIDLGPDAGDQGGKIVAEGTPEDVAGAKGSHTGEALREVTGLGRRMVSQFVKPQS